MSVRVGRWIVPGAGLTLALAGVVFLLASEVVADSALGSGAAARSNPTDAAAPSPSTTPRAGGKGVELSPRPPAKPSARSAAPAPARPLPPVTHGRPLVRETKAVLRASPTIAALAQAPNLVERLRRLEELLQALTPEQAVATLEGLLDAELPGDFYEAETLRLRVLARLGEVPGPAAEELLVACLDSARPRSQRLLAVEVLSVRASAGRGQLEGIARQDHDPVVQEKARWVLDRQLR